ncbi:MAG TPA: zinc-ribbon domain containing protein [bacterium]
MEALDKTIQCATCGREFIFTVKEQGFFAQKGFKEPRHCRECRQQRKQAQVQALDQAISAQPVLRVKEMFRVVCANCRRETLVPFRPITGKPVLCKDCFIAQRYGVTTAAASEAAKKKAASEAEEAARAAEAPAEAPPPAPRPSGDAEKTEAPAPTSGDIQKTEAPAPSDDLQQQMVQSDSPPESEKPPITEQSSQPESHKLAAKEPGSEP